MENSSNKRNIACMVCGMEFEPTEKSFQAVHEGETYYFCSMNCKDKFLIVPDKYIL